MNQNNQNNQMITTLNEIIEKQQNEERNSPHSTKLIQMKMELNKLQAENNDLKNCSQILSLKNFSLDSEVTELRQRLELTTGTCSSLENKCDIITAEKEKTIKEYEDKISNFKLFKIQAADLKNTLDKILLKMSTIKQYFLKSQQERSELLQERQDLVIRAAVGFDNLTPRPNYTQLCIDKNLSFSSLIPKLERKKKTNSFYIVDILLNKICEYQAKIAFMDAELKDKKRQGDFVISQQMRKASTTNQKSSFRGVGASPSKSSKMISVDGLDKRSRFITINTDEDSKIIKDKDSNKESPEKNTGVFDFKMEFLKNEEEGDKKEEHGEEREEVKETERIISEIIESKKKIEQFGILK